MSIYDSIEDSSRDILELVNAVDAHILDVIDSLHNIEKHDTRDVVTQKVTKAIKNLEEIRLVIW